MVDRRKERKEADKQEERNVDSNSMHKGGETREERFAIVTGLCEQRRSITRIETRRDINAGTRSAGCTFVHESSSQWLCGLRIVLSVIQSSSTRFTITSRKADRRFMSHPYHELAHLWEFVTRSFDIRSCPGISAIVYYAIHEDAPRR